MQQTKKIAKDMAEKLKKGEIICLFGDLGSGKTVFVQGLAEGLGIKKRILSPSFVFEREYDLVSGAKFYHIDLYRIGDIDEASNLGLKELFEDKNNTVAIEWAEKIISILPQKRTDVHIDFLNGKKRRIKITRRS